MIGIVCVAQIELSPFAKKYMAVFEKNGVKYDIIHWDRSGEKREDKENVYTYTKQLDRYAPKIKKLLPFIGFSRFAEKIIKQKKYQSLVVLTTQTALLIPAALFKYRKRYFFDYRDTSYEYIKPYSFLINKIADFSMGMCISSPGFKEYIKTKTNMVVAHNFQDKAYAERKKTCVKKENGKIVMGYIGVLREYEYLKKMVSAFGSDERFEFFIHGGGDDLEKLKKYSENFKNVKVFGAYKEDEKQSILESFDMICYNYPHSFVNYPAIANKFYDGMLSKKPMFANSRTFSGGLIEKYALGISLDQDEADLTEKIYDYYKNFDAKEFENNCEAFLNTVIEDEKKYISEIEKIIN